MNAADNGGPAFPPSHQNLMHGGPLEGFEGMSLRDYFAAKALPALLTSTASWRDLGLVPSDGLDDKAQYARFAYQFADAMLAARKGDAS